MLVHQAVYVKKKHRGNHDYVVDAGVKLCKDYEACYGGKWIVVQQTSHLEMSKQLNEHRGIDVSKLIPGRFAKSDTTQSSTQPIASVA